MSFLFNDGLLPFPPAITVHDQPFNCGFKKKMLCDNISSQFIETKDV